MKPVIMDEEDAENYWRNLCQELLDISFGMAAAAALNPELAKSDTDCLKQWCQFVKDHKDEIRHEKVRR